MPIRVSADNDDNHTDDGQDCTNTDAGQGQTLGSFSVAYDQLLVSLKIHGMVGLENGKTEYKNDDFLLKCI